MGQDFLAFPESFSQNFGDWSQNFEDITVPNGVVDRHFFLAGTQDARLAQNRQMLGKAGLLHIQIFNHIPDGRFLIFQVFDDLKPHWMRQGLEEIRLDFKHHLLVFGHIYMILNPVLIRNHPVSHAQLGFQILGPQGVFFQFFSQLMHVNAH